MRASVYVSVCVCVCACICVCLTVCLCLPLSICLSLCLSGSLVLRLEIHLPSHIKFHTKRMQYFPAFGVPYITRPWLNPTFVNSICLTASPGRLGHLNSATVRIEVVLVSSGESSLNKGRGRRERPWQPQDRVNKKQLRLDTFKMFLSETIYESTTFIASINPGELCKVDVNGPDIHKVSLN